MQYQKNAGGSIVPNERDFPLDGKRVFVAGHQGMVGSAIVRALRRRDCRILVAPRAEVDLRRQHEVERWMREERPDAVFLAAARVGGIQANDSRPAEFIYDNLAIELAVIESARIAGVRKLLFLGSSCIYPRMASQPMTEDALMTGPLEPTNQWYAIAKIAGIGMCRAYRRQYGCNYISLMPTNLYGPGDNFDLEDAHVIPALMRKLHEAKTSGRDEVTIWGSGRPRREFLHVDDLASAAVYLMETYAGEQHVNVGTGHDLTTAELAEMLKDVTEFRGRLVYDRTKPDGAPRKLLDVTRLTELGWCSSIGLHAGLSATYDWFVEAGETIRRRRHKEKGGMEIRDGRMLTCPTRNSSGKRIVRDGDFSIYGTLRALSPGLILDIGAAAGFATRLMLENSPDSEVLAFEPWTGNHGFFMKTIGDDFRTTLIKKAVADWSGTGLFRVGSTVQGTEPGWEELRGYSSLGHLVKTKATSNHSIDQLRPDCVRVPTVTVDEVVERRHIRFMKVDVQGGEQGVLRGASRTLVDGRVDLMYLEFSGDETLLDYLSFFPLSVFDSEYLLIPKNRKIELQDWEISGQANLSTAREAYRGYPKDRPVDSEGYARFMTEQIMKIGIIQTDLIVVSNQILPMLVDAVNKLRT